MFYQGNRRAFLRTAAAGGAAWGLGNLAFLDKLPPVRAQEAAPDTGAVQMRPEIEPLVRLLEETPRDKLLETVAARIHGGLTYREVLAALLLAGVRNVQPRPAVGFKFHSVLVVNSAHLASISSPDEHRWLPIFWALDYFKQTQAEDVSEGDWTMAPVKEGAVPAAGKAREAFIAAMDHWDAEAADAAVAGLARTAGAADVYELMFRYGCRDFRSIGHKAIFVANSWRTLQCIGWRYAEPVLRSLTYALMNHTGEPNPAESDRPADRPGRRNAELAARLRADWTSGKLDAAATGELLSALRADGENDVCDLAVDVINRGVHPQSVWDAIFLGGGELLLRQRGIVALHALTSANALHFAYQASGDERTRQMLLLQAAAFLPLFREAMRRRGEVADAPIDRLEPAPLESPAGGEIEEVFAGLNADRTLAARKVLTLLAGSDAARLPQQLIDAGRVLVFLKGTNAHDYKFSSAILEDYYNVSPAWRNRFLAAGVYNLRGAGDRDNRLVQRTRAALEG